MKVTDIRRKLIAALVAGGTLAPGALRAADLNTNIVVNGDFESVDPMTISNYGSVKILNWDDGSRVGFAYSHDGSMNGFGTVIPDYANGTLANGGHFYFAPPATPGWPNVAREVSQIIDVSDGVSGALVPTGTIGYVLQGDMSSYLAQGDWGEVYVEFLNSSGAHIGAAQINNQNPGSTWLHKSSAGGVPAGTKTIHVSLIGHVGPVAGAPDGYIDNVDLQLTASVPQLVLLVDRNTGNITLNNLTGSLENISGYSITSEFGGLKPASWLSIADNYDSGNAGPNQVDATNAWDELTMSSSRGDLSEGDLSSGTGANLADDRVVNLGNAWITTPVEDLLFQYISNGEVITGVVGYVGNNNDSLPLGDLNANGTINSTDWAIFRANQHADMTGLSLAEAYKLGDLNRDLQNDHADFILFKEVFEVTNGAGSFAAMLSSVPEPATAILVLAGGLFAVPIARRSARRT